MGSPKIDAVTCACFVILNRLACEYVEGKTTDQSLRVAPIIVECNSDWTLPTVISLLIAVSLAIFVIVYYIYGF